MVRFFAMESCLFALTAWEKKQDSGESGSATAGIREEGERGRLG